MKPILSSISINEKGKLNEWVSLNNKVMSLTFNSLKEIDGKICFMFNPKYENKQ